MNLSVTFSGRADRMTVLDLIQKLQRMVILEELSETAPVTSHIIWKNGLPPTPPVIEVQEDGTVTIS